MKVIVTADGTMTGTKVTDESGNPVDGVTEVMFRHQAGGLPEIEVGISLCPVVVSGEAKMYGANGKAVKSITYEDGTVVEY
jgi:hypothetical protein